MIQDPLEGAELFVSKLKKSQNAVVLTGAGVSTDSGIPDFRGPSGLYSKISQRTFEIDFFCEFPEDYYQIALEHIHPLADKEPNATHRMLSKLESLHLIKSVITQNIDGLHQKAGSLNVIEFHGNVVRFYCTKCEKVFIRKDIDDQIRTKGIPVCNHCHALIRPGIVFFGDQIPLDALYTSMDYADQADFFVAMGSSLEVNPAASIAIQAKQTGADLCIINRGPTRLDSLADLRIETDLKIFSENVLSLLGA